jgi:hypothetical protein
LTLDKSLNRAKIAPTDDQSPASLGPVRLSAFMTPIQPPKVPATKTTPAECKHPRVQIVSRDEDAEFVECVECGDIFDSSEFRDMNIEETKLKDQL